MRAGSAYDGCHAQVSLLMSSVAIIDMLGLFQSGAVTASMTMLKE